LTIKISVAAAFLARCILGTLPAMVIGGPRWTHNGIATKEFYISHVPSSVIHIAETTWEFSELIIAKVDHQVIKPERAM
jgi:hypothetical protein